MNKLILFRRTSQILFSLLFIYILWSTTYPLTGPFPAGIFFQFDPLIVFMISLSERIIVPGVLLSLIMIAISLVLGRFFCGWVCPLGAMIDLAGGIKKRYPAEADIFNRVARKIKFYILGLTGAVAIAGIQVIWIFDPMVIMGRFVSLNLIPTITLALDSAFIFIMRDLGVRGVVQDIYRAMKPTILGVQAHYFSNSAIILAFFLIVLSLSLIRKRFWCRAFCPLGAIYSLVSGKAILRRTYDGCTSCGACKSECRMGAIRDDLSYARGECILCMDCVYNCPQRVTRFTLRIGPGPKSPPAGKGAGPVIPRGVSRKEFLFLLASSFLSLGFRFRNRTVRHEGRPVIRPPAAPEEEDFTDRCVRCGNCMKVCITNGLQPAFLESGLRGIWTPQLIPEIGYCEYQCTLCGHTCPTGAIPRLSVEQKKLARLGLAEIDRSICLPWAYGKECIVCQEHCPVPDKAIKIERVVIDGAEIYRPHVDKHLCIGCGICQNKCPVRPVRAVRVIPI